jgi:hypothetical protein
LKSAAKRVARADVVGRIFWNGWFRAVLGLVGAFGLARGADLPNQAGGAAFLDHFRKSIYAEPVYIGFELREMPRRGGERLYHGRLWGARNAGGPVARFELDAAEGAPAHHILVQGGPDSALWVCDPPGPARRSETALMAPLIPGLQMTPFDLQMPYLYWLDAALTGERRIRGRPAYVFAFTPPGDFAAGNPGIGSVRVYLDTQYDALMQSEIVGANGRVAKTLSLLELRKVGDRWLPRDLDVRDDATRDKTRLSVTAIAIGISVDPATFDPDHLAGAASAPPASSVTRVTQ